MTSSLDIVLSAIDAANLKDPNTTPDDAGEPQPEAYLYGRRMSEQLQRLFGAETSEVLQIAARGQHIERWLIPRSDYPEGRAGYLAWRRDQGRAHGERLAGLMTDAGYDTATTDRVRVLAEKRGLKREPEVQRLEDVICFTFLTWYFAPFAAKHTEEKVLDIVAKTARKMSPQARARALAEFDLSDPLADAVRAAA